MLRYLGVIFLITAATASAQQMSQNMSMADRMALRDNCKQDIQKLCPGIEPGGGKVMACIKEKQSELSQACSATISDLMARKQN